VRRWADEVTPSADGDVVTLRYAEPESMAAWLVGFGAEVVILDPPEVRDAAVARLREIFDAHGGTAADVGVSAAGVG
jgi:proteasome accessory factor B